MTLYEIANRIHQGAAMAQSIAASALLPATAYLRRDRATLRELYLRGTTYTVAVALPVMVAAFIFAEDLIRTWVGESLIDATGAARLFLVFVAFVVVHATGTAMIVALGHMRFVISVTVAFTVINLARSIALVPPLGVNGVILGTLVAQAAIWLPYTSVLLPRVRREPGGSGCARSSCRTCRDWSSRSRPPRRFSTSRTPPATSCSWRCIALLSVALSLAGFVAVGLSARRATAPLLGANGALGRAGPQSAGSWWHP